MTDPLRRELRRLAAELAPRGIPVIIGGGYGLLLRQQRVEDERERAGVETLMEVPVERATRDLDVFLTVEVLADARKAEAIRDALGMLGYTVVPGYESYQFEQPVDEVEAFPRGVKVDLLAPVPADMGAYPALQLDGIRNDQRKIRNRAVRSLNAFATPAAFTVGEQTEPFSLSEDGSGEGDDLHAEIPHPFTYLVLKLFAYRDRQHDETNDYRYHAYDLYRIVAMMTEAEVEVAAAMHERFGSDPVVVEATRIAAALFADADQPGAVAVQGYAQVVGSDLSVDDVSEFCRHLRDLLPTGEEQPAA